jgi:hypothetical protein
LNNYFSIPKVLTAKQPKNIYFQSVRDNEINSALTVLSTKFRLYVKEEFTENYPVPGFLEKKKGEVDTTFLPNKR